MEKTAMVPHKVESPLAIRRKDRRKVLTNILSNSSVTGLSRAASVSSKWLQVFWTFLFAGGVIGFGVNFNSILNRHRKEPVLTQINHEYTNFVWPHITFCNPSNPISFWRKPNLTSKWTELIMKSKVFQSALRSQKIRVKKEELAMSSLSPHEFHSDGVKGLVFMVRAYFRVSRKMAKVSGSFDEYEFIRNFPQAFEDRLTSLTFPLPCYTLLPELLFRNNIEKLSQLNSIKVYLLLDYQSYLFFNSGFQNRKLYMYLTVPNSTITPADPFFINPGSTSHFQVTENRFRRIKRCHDHELKVNLYDSLLRSSRDYGGVFNDCRYNISQRLYYTHCGCYSHSLPISKVTQKSPRLCLNMTLYNETEIIRNMKCLQEVRNLYNKNNVFGKFLDQECSEFKVSLCNQRSYSFIRRTNIWPTKINAERREKLIFHASRLPNARMSINGTKLNVTEDFTLNNLAIIDFHRGTDMSVLTFEEWEYPLPEFLSDVGGILGLWLGLSVIGVFELIELIIMFLISPFVKDEK